LRRRSAILIGAALLGILLIPGGSASPVVKYGHTLGGSGSEAGRIIGIDGAGNVYQFGTTSSYVAGSFLAKRDPQGNVLWERILDFGGTLQPVGLAVTPDGTAYFTGRFGGNLTGGTIVGKVLPDGTLGFSKFTNDSAGPNAIAYDPVSGGALVTGIANWSPQTGVVFAVDANGSFRWGASTNGTTIPLTAAVDANGTAFIATTRLFSGQADAGIVTFDESGALLHARRLDIPYNDEYGWSVTLGPDGDVYFLGFSYAHTDPIFARFTPDLVPQWSEYLGSPSLYDFCWRIVSPGDGTFYAQGDYYNYSSGQIGSVSYRIDSSGALVDSGLLPSSGAGGSTLHVQDVAVGPNGTVILSGSSYGSPPRNETPIGDAHPTSIIPPWVSEPSVWHAQAVSLSDRVGSLTDPNFAADDFRAAAGDQAWYGALVLPASPVSATASANITDRDHRIVTFSANVSGGTPPYTYLWSFGDANSSTDANPNHTYSTGGQYPVQLIVEDSASNRAYSIVDVLLGGPPVITNVTISPSPTYARQYTFFDAAGFDPDGSIVDWRWDFGDGTSWDSSYPGAYHVYYALGTYNVTVTARDNDGLETSASRLLQVLDQPPYACFYVYPNPTVVGYPTNFQDCSYDPDGYIVSSTWNFGDGGNASGTYVSHPFASPGSYVVRLTVTDNAGISSSTNQTVIVNVNQLPVARFTYFPSQPVAGQGISFDGTGSTDPDGYITLWTWDFGDGTNVTTYPGYAYHSYAQGGQYTVTLTVTDNFNAMNRTSKSLYVDIPPTATFTTSRAFGKVGTPLVFDASASNDPDGRIVRYEWTFGDGGNGTDSGAIVTHVFAAPGTYTVTLVVWDDHNATAYFQRTISVVPPKAPFAVLSYTPSRPFVGVLVSYNGSLSADPDGAIVRYVWQFGDGAVAEGALVTHRYTHPGTYVVHLTVVDEDGFAVTTSSDLTAVSQPIAAFSVAPNPIHVGEDATFTANGSWDLTGHLTYHWDFGDGTHGEGWQTSKRYGAPGTYHVTLNVTNSFGVSAEAVMDVVVDPSAQAVTTAGLPVAMIMVSAIVSVGAVAVAAGIYLWRRKQTPRQPGKT
jgi:PKD repeat protein